MRKCVGRREDLIIKIRLAERALGLYAQELKREKIEELSEIYNRLYKDMKARGILKGSETVAEIERISGSMAGGTYLLGEMRGVSFSRLCSVFGEPARYEGDKIDAEWVLRFGPAESGFVFTLYNWKNGPSYGGPRVESNLAWTIGAGEISASQIEALRGALKTLLGGSYSITR